MQKVAASTLTTIRARFVDANGVGVDATGAVTVAVVDGVGVEVVADTADSEGSGVYSLPVDLSTLDEYTATWVGAFSGDAERTISTRFDVVGSVPLTVAEVRALDEGFADTVKYPADAVQAEIDAAWDQLDRVLQVAIVPRGRRVTLSGSGTTDLLLSDFRPIEVVSATVDGSAVSGALLDPAGIVYLESGWARGRGNVSLHYTHGWESTPEPVLRALKVLTADRIVPSAMPARATSLNTDVGAFRITTAGRDGYTGIPDVDSVIDQFGYAKAGGFA